MKPTIEDLYQEALKSVQFLSNSEEAKERIVRARFCQLIVNELYSHLMNTSDRYRKEYFAEKVRERFKNEML